MLSKQLTFYMLLNKKEVKHDYQNSILREYNSQQLQVHVDQEVIHVICELIMWFGADNVVWGLIMWFGG